MQIVLQTEECGGFVRCLPVRQLDARTRLRALTRFDDYREKGVVLNGVFEENHWQLTNQLHTFALDFTIDASLYQRKAEQWIGCTAECYQECMKAFTVFQLGSYTLAYLQLIASRLRALAGLNIDEARDYPTEEVSAQIVGFLSLIPDSNDLRDLVIESLNERKWVVKSTGPRKLADFGSYLRFNRALDTYWLSAPNHEKLFYFPVYFWWKLTAILPLRCTEFLLTPRDCIHKEGHRRLLSVRRTKLKKNSRRHSYLIEHDYLVQTYEIPVQLFEEIRRYQEATRKDNLPGLGTLLVPDHVVPSGYFSYTQMSHRLRRFCREVLNDVSYPIHVGDTRHLAMINLMLSGGSPVICRELAGHESIDVSSNYYANLSSIVESVVYERHHGWSESPMMEGTLRFSTVLPMERIRVGDGWCDVPEVARGDVSECLKHCDRSGQIGICINCPHFYPDSPGLRIQIEKNCKKNVDEDGMFLMQMIEQVRKGLGYEEEIGSALLRLQNSTQRYAAALTKKYLEETENGKAQKE